MDGHSRALIAAAATVLRSEGVTRVDVPHALAQLERSDGTPVRSAAAVAAEWSDPDALLAAALESAMTEVRAHLVAPLPAGPDALPRFADAYLSDAHVQDPAQGCPIAAVGSELARAPQAVRGRFELQLELLLRELRDASDADRAQILSVLSLCVGAVTLSRALPGSGDAREILDAARRAADTLTRGQK